MTAWRRVLHHLRGTSARGDIGARTFPHGKLRSERGEAGPDAFAGHVNALQRQPSLWRLGVVRPSPQAIQRDLRHRTRNLGGVLTVKAAL